MIHTHDLTPGKHATGTPARWIEVWEPSAGELAELRETYGLHELSLEDAARPGHPPKYEPFEDHLFAIVHTPAREADGRNSLKVALFLSATWIVTIVRREHAELRARFDGVRDAVARSSFGPARVFHLLLDGLTDGFETEVDGIDDSLEQLEAQLTESDPRAFMGNTLEIRRHLLELVHTVRDQRDVARSVESAVHPAIPARLRPYFRDVHDHLIRVYGRLETARDLLGGLRDAYFSAADHRLNQVMRVLTVIATIMMPLSLVAGLYGMNVAMLPGADASSSFWWIVGAMVLASVGMLWIFRRKGWL